MKKTSLVLALLLMMSFVLCACGASNELVGTWVNSKNSTIEFADDGTGVLTEDIIVVDFTYVVDEEEGTVTLIPDPSYEDLETQTHEYTIDGDTLSMYGETFTRQ